MEMDSDLFDEETAKYKNERSREKQVKYHIIFQKKKLNLVQAIVERQAKWREIHNQAMRNPLKKNFQMPPDNGPVRIHIYFKPK